jgi:hypothetical protein
LLLLGAALLAGLLLLGACGDDEELQGLDPWLTVSLAPGFQPLPGIKVVIMDGATNSVAAGPAISDAEGKCTFPGLEGGPYQVVPFAGSHHEVVSIAPSSWDLRYWPSKSQGSLISAPDKTPPAPSGPMIWMETLVTPGALPRIAGVVTDAGTGEPLEAAFISLYTAMGGYTGTTRFYDDVTLADGTFSVTEIPFAQDPENGHLVQIMPLLIHREGYRPRSWYHSAANGDDNLDISGVVIPLEPIDPGATGGIQGRLLLLGEPAAGVAVGISASAGGKSAVGQPGLATLTDQEGRFLLSGVPEGHFYLEPGFMVGDGVVSYFPAGHHPSLVLAEQITGAGDLFLLHEITLYTPAAAGWYLNTEVMFPMEWSAVPGAVRYQIMVDRGTIGESITHRLEQPEGFQLSAGIHFWSVVAFDDQDRQIGAVEKLGRFTLGDPES